VRDRRQLKVPVFAATTFLILVSVQPAVAETRLKQSLTSLGATLRSGITLKDMEVLRIELTAEVAKAGAVPSSVSDELNAIAGVQDLWDIIIHGWTCRNFTAHEAACIATVSASMTSLGLKVTDDATPETMLKDALALLMAKNDKSLADLVRH
jgi:hypothetical protein